MEAELEEELSSPRKILAVTTSCEYCNRVIRETPLKFDRRMLPIPLFKPLDATVIGEASEKILQESHASFLAELVRDAHEINELVGFTLEDAYTGIINELIH